MPIGSYENKIENFKNSFTNDQSVQDAYSQFSKIIKNTEQSQNENEATNLVKLIMPSLSEYNLNKNDIINVFREKLVDELRLSGKSEAEITAIANNVNALYQSIDRLRR